MLWGPARGVLREACCAGSRAEQLGARRGAACGWGRLQLRGAHRLVHVGEALDDAVPPRLALLLSRRLIGLRLVLALGLGPGLGLGLG